MAYTRSTALAALILAGAAAPAFAAADFRDVAVVFSTISHVLETERSGVEVPWSNPETGNSGYVVAVRTYYIEDRMPCRDYRRSMTSPDGTVMLVTGTGCRSAAGRWRLDENNDAEPAPAGPSSPAGPPSREPELAALPPEDPGPAAGPEPSWSAGPAPEPVPEARVEPPPRETRVPSETPAPSEASGREAGRPAERAATPVPTPPTPKRRPTDLAGATTLPSTKASTKATSGSVSISLPSRSEG